MGCLHLVTFHNLLVIAGIVPGQMHGKKISRRRRQRFGELRVGKGRHPLLYRLVVRAQYQTPDQFGEPEGRSGRRPAGGIHLSTLVELHWTAPDGRERQQTLFAEIQDGRPVLSVGRGRVLLSVTYCPAGQACRQATLPFAWDGRLGRFVGADRAARNSLAHTGAAEPDSTPIPDVPARSGNR